MKKKKENLPKLILNKETIAYLTPHNLGFILAGDNGTGGGTRKNCGDGDDLDLTQVNCRYPTFK